MKNLISIVVTYVIFSFFVCFAISSFINVKPELIPGEELKYMILQGLLFFFKFFPAVISSGFLIGCAIIFTGNTSIQIKLYFKKVITNSVILISVIFISSELIAPEIKDKIYLLEESPKVFKEFYSLAEDCFKEGQMTLAEKYISKALVINPNDENSLVLKDRAISAKRFESKFNFDNDIDDTKMQELPSFEVGNFSYHEFANETVDSLLKKSDEAFNRENWFDAHYYAFLAVEAGIPNNPNYDKAKLRSIDAWSHINKPLEFEDSQEMRIFRQKRLAYTMLTNGDNLNAYYKFLEISNISEQIEKDADVRKYLKIAKERVQKQYFFIDDVDDLKRLETNNDVHFSVVHKDGYVDVVYIKGITHLSEMGTISQYLRGLSIYTFDKDGNYRRSIYAPYAKMISKPAREFGEAVYSNFNIESSSTPIPFIYIQGINSKMPEVISPVFDFVDEEEKRKFEEDNLGYNYFNINHNVTIYTLGLSISDFNLLCECSNGANDMSLISLWRVYGKAEDFGYSSEIFGTVLLRRVTGPLVYWCLFLILSCIALNYKIGETQIFKFKYIFLLPVATLVLYFIIELVRYIMHVLNYVFVACAGYYAIFMALFIEILLLIFFSTVFVLKRERK